MEFDLDEYQIQRVISADLVRPGSSCFDCFCLFQPDVEAVGADRELDVLLGLVLKSNSPTFYCCGHLWLSAKYEQ